MVLWWGVLGGSEEKIEAAVSTCNEDSGEKYVPLKYHYNLIRPMLRS